VVNGRDGAERRREDVVQRYGNDRRDLTEEGRQADEAVFQESERTVRTRGAVCRLDCAGGLSQDIWAWARWEGIYLDMTSGEICNERGACDEHAGDDVGGRLVVWFNIGDSDRQAGDTCAVSGRRLQRLPTPAGGGLSCVLAEAEAASTGLPVMRVRCRGMEQGLTLDAYDSLR